MVEDSWGDWKLLGERSRGDRWIDKLTASWAFAGVSIYCWDWDLAGVSINCIFEWFVFSNFEDTCKGSIRYLFCFVGSWAHRVGICELSVACVFRAYYGFSRLPAPALLRWVLLGLARFPSCPAIEPGAIKKKIYPAHISLAILVRGRGGITPQCYSITELITLGIGLALDFVFGA